MHHETHAYGYATALLSRRWRPDTLASYRAKVAALECTEGQMQLLERFPSAFIKGGWAVVTIAAQSDRPCKGRQAYEADCIARPVYHDGARRCHWDALGDAVQSNWRKYA